MKLIELRGGARSNFELAIRFADWCDMCTNDPTWKQVMRAFQVERATAFRWLAAYRSARKSRDLEKVA